MVNAYLANINSDTVAVINTANNNVIATITTSSFGSVPSGVAVTPNGQYAYITNAGASNVIVVNTSNNHIIATISVSFEVDAVAISPDGSKAYVTAAGNVAVINTNTIIETITVGGASYLAMTPDGTKAYLSTFVSGGSVSVINTSNYAVTETIAVGSASGCIAITPDSSAVYVITGSGGSVSVINTSNNNITKTISVSNGSVGVAITPDGKEVYLSGSPVLVVDTTSYAITHTIPITGSSVGGVAITPDGSQVYVQSSSYVSVISTSSHSVSATIGVFGDSLGQFIQPAAGEPDMGYINKFHNGTMDIWQRGTGSTTVATSGAYVADGWIVVPTGASCTAQQATNSRTGALTTYSLQVTGATNVSDVVVKQRIESLIAQQLEGQTVTVQAWIYYTNTGGNITPTLTIKNATAADNWSSTTTQVSAASLQPCPVNTWTQVAYTFSASSSSGNGLEISFDLGSNFSTTGKSAQITELDIRATPGAATGLNSSPPAIELRPVSAELSYCQRYFAKTYPQGTAPGTTGTQAGALACITSGTWEPSYNWRFPVSMRTTPATITPYNWSSSGTSGQWRNHIDTTSSANLNTFYANTDCVNVANTGTTLAAGVWLVQLTVSAEL